MGKINLHENRVISWYSEKRNRYVITKPLSLIEGAWVNLPYNERVEILRDKTINADMEKLWEASRKRRRGHVVKAEVIKFNQAERGLSGVVESRSQYNITVYRPFIYGIPLLEESNKEQSYALKDRMHGNCTDQEYSLISSRSAAFSMRKEWELKARYPQLYPSRIVEIPVDYLCFHQIALIFKAVDNGKFPTFNGIFDKKNYENEIKKWAHCMVRTKMILGDIDETILADVMSAKKGPIYEFTQLIENWKPLSIRCAKRIEKVYNRFEKKLFS